jgi:two-component system chemotaxis response regulator CheY
MPTVANISLLVVDDQKSIRSLVKECLKGLGYTRIAECEDGAQALRHLQTHTVHMVISDLNMPNMTGLELLAAVRAAPELKHLGFLMLTSRGEVDLVRQAIQLGVNNYLTKPFTMGDLKKKIESVLGPLR